MPTTVRAAFDDFLARLEPTDRQKSDAATKQNGVRACLAVPLYVAGAFLTGSYARHTMIKPPNDIDLFIVLDADKHSSTFYTILGAQQALESFHRNLKACYPMTPIRKAHPAIHLDFSTYGLDVVPAFDRYRGGYLIPSRFGSGWISTDPTKHADRTTSVNKTTSGYFVPLVKMFKSWNATHASKLTGFHLEMALANAWPTRLSTFFPPSTVLVTYTSYAAAIAALFPALSARLAFSTPDPAGLSGSIDDYLQFLDRMNIRGRLTTAGESAQVALRHEARGDHRSAIAKWREIFGDPFPVYS
jgi:hypothetical protein